MSVRDDDDDTIMSRPPEPEAPIAAPRSKPSPPVRTAPRAGFPIWRVLIPGAVLLAGASTAWIYLSAAPAHAPPPPPMSASSVAPPPFIQQAMAPAIEAQPPRVEIPVPPAPEAVPAANPALAIETANERQIRDHVSTGLTLFRLDTNAAILVLDFATLRDQGRMLNRIGVLIEKFGMPRDRLVTDQELDQAVRDAGDTFYYGHDYSAASLARFFALADRDKIALSADEELLRRLLRQERWFDPGTRGGLISVPRTGANAHVTAEARATILHHELSHGEYFSNPGFAAFVHQFWSHTLTSGERERIRRYLKTEGYDTANDEVMENEAQAYLIFTDAPEFFTPAWIGMSRSRLATLRSAFLAGMPKGWLHESLGRTLADAGAAVP